MSRRTLSIIVLVVSLTSLSGSAVFYNVAPIDQQEGPEPAVQVRDYSVGYAENVEDRYIGSVTIPFVDFAPQLNTSGVIVTSERRYVWRTIVHPARLENRGRASFLLGGLGWRERVFVNRTGWTLTGGETVYQVYLRPASDERTLAFSSEPANADPRIAGRNISMRSVDRHFEFVVSRRGEMLGSTAVPGVNTTVSAGGLTFSRNQSKVYATANRTRVAIAHRNGNR